jgi:hypothetical protein
MHPVNRIVSVEHVAQYVLRIRFDDGLVREVDLGPVLAGEIYAPLRDLAVFASVRVDPESHTIVWSNGADFDPSILHDWPEHAQAFAAAARRWSPVATAPRSS